MTDTCAYERSGQYVVKRLDGDIRELRGDVDALLALVTSLRDDVVALRLANTRLRDRIDMTEMVFVR